MLISDDDQQTSIYIHLLCFFTIQYEYKEDTVSNDPLVNSFKVTNHFDQFNHR